MIVGYVGVSALSELIANRLVDSFEVRQLPVVGAVPEQVSSCDVIVIAQKLPGGILGFLEGCGLLSNRSEPRPVVIDQTVADPDETRMIASELAKFGIELVDAPIQYERSEVFPEASAILCGGKAVSVERMKPVLELMCPKVIYFGDWGNGHAARVLVGTVAAFNRMSTYECAAMAIKNGLSIEDMVQVLNRSSGANSATERILPRLASREKTSDAQIVDLAAELRLASQLGMRVGTPMMLPNLIADMVQLIANLHDDEAKVDEMVDFVERSAGIRFQ